MHLEASDHLHYGALVPVFVMQEGSTREKEPQDRAPLTPSVSQPEQPAHAPSSNALADAAHAAGAATQARVKQLGGLADNSAGERCWHECTYLVSTVQMEPGS